MKNHKVKTSQAWIPTGFTIESHTDLDTLDISKLKMELYTSPSQKNGGRIKGEDLLKEVKSPLNSTVLKYLLDNPTLIPESWKEKVDGYITYIYFFGTTLRDSHGRRYVLCLYWSDGEWDWSVGWLNYDFDQHSVSAVLAGTSSSDTLPSLDTQSLELRVEKLEQTIENLKQALL